MSAREREMGKMLNKFKISGAAGLAALMAAPAMAQDAGPVMDKGDVSWMLVSTILVLFMILPGLALFYGGLVRAKNMLSVLMQVTMITAMVMVIWVVYGYSFAFGGGVGPCGGGRCGGGRREVGLCGAAGGVSHPRRPCGGGGGLPPRGGGSRRG